MPENIPKIHPESQKRQPAADRTPEKDTRQGAESSLMPPAFHVTASYRGDTGGHQSSTQAHSAALQRSTTTVSLPERLGPRQEGPIAHRAAGDDHAFSPNDINQGSIGDCYFLASLGAVAHTNPGLLRRAITQNSDGTFSVRLYIEKTRGWWIFSRTRLEPVSVKLYPTFPLSVDGTDTANPDAGASPAHAHGGDPDEHGRTELWVRLVEKAFALIMGSYAQIGNGGFAADALEALTGERFTERVMDQRSRARIIEMVEQNIPVTVSTHAATFENLPDDLQNFADENSIVGGHAYTVINANESTIRVRNPHGANARNAEPVMTWEQFDGLFRQFSDRD